MTMTEVRKLLLRECKKCRPYAGSGTFTWCREHGVSRSRVNEFLNGKRLPTADILEALGLEWRVMRKIGHRRHSERPNNG